MWFLDVGGWRFVAFNREKIREAYRDEWMEMDPEKLIATLAPGFIFDDPALCEHSLQCIADNASGKYGRYSAFHARSPSRVGAPETRVWRAGDTRLLLHTNNEIRIIFMEI